MELSKRIKLKIGNDTFSCNVWFQFTKGYPAKLTGHPDDQYEGVANTYEIEHLTIYAGGAHWNVNYLIDSLTDAIELELDNLC